MKNAQRVISGIFQRKVLAISTPDSSTISSNVFTVVNQANWLVSFFLSRKRTLSFDMSEIRSGECVAK